MAVVDVAAALFFIFILIHSLGLSFSPYVWRDKLKKCEAGRYDLINHFHAKCYRQMRFNLSVGKTGKSSPKHIRLILCRVMFTRFGFIHNIGFGFPHALPFSLSLSL